MPFDRLCSSTQIVLENEWTPHGFLCWFCFCFLFHNSCNRTVPFQCFFQCTPPRQPDLRLKDICTLVSRKKGLIKVARQQFRPFKMSLDMLAHIVTMVVGKSLATYATTEYAFFVSVNHRLDKGIHTCEIHFINTLFTRHAQRLDLIYDTSSNGQRDCCEFWMISDILPPHSGEWLTCVFLCGFSCDALLPSLSGTQCIWTWSLHCSPPPLRSYRWSQHPDLGNEF